MGKLTLKGPKLTPSQREGVALRGFLFRIAVNLTGILYRIMSLRWNRGIVVRTKIDPNRGGDGLQLKNGKRLEQSQSRRMLRLDEKALLKSLMVTADEESFIPADLDSLEVIPMDDGGMGSLLLIPHGVEQPRQFGKEVSLQRFVDSDGTPIFVSLNVDRQQRLFEIDIWKVDFSPVIEFPKC
jgi:hypothetical protein